MTICESPGSCSWAHKLTSSWGVISSARNTICLPEDPFILPLRVPHTTVIRISLSSLPSLPSLYNPQLSFEVFSGASGWGNDVALYDVIHFRWLLMLARMLDVCNKLPMIVIVLITRFFSVVARYSDFGFRILCSDQIRRKVKKASWALQRKTPSCKSKVQGKFDLNAETVFRICSPSLRVAFSFWRREI